MATKLGTCSTQNTPDLPYVQTVQPGKNVNVDSTDPRNPVVSSTGGGGGAGGINNQSGTAYTLTLADLGSTIVTSTSSSFTLTIPTNATVAFAIGALVAYTQGGTGAITITGAAGVTIYGSNGFTTAEQWDGGVLQQIATNVWQVWNGPMINSMALVADAPSSTATYGRYQNTWAPVAPEAPNDGQQYARQSLAWKVVAATGGITGINTQFGSSYTLAASDATQIVSMTYNSACAVIVPANASVALPLYTIIPIFQSGPGTVTISGASGVTVDAPNGSTTLEINDFRTLMQLAANTWVIG